jgi:hypothetical protein
MESRLTGVYRLDLGASDDPRAAAERVIDNSPFNLDRERAVDELTQRLTSPNQLSIQRRGQKIDIASTRAPRTTFDADGRERAEASSDGQTVYTRAVLYNDQLMVSSRGGRNNEYSVTFDPLEGGRRLRVTRRIFSEQVDQPVVVQSVYQKTAAVARWSVYGEQLPPIQTATRNTPRPAPRTTARNRPPQSPPVIRERAPQQFPPPPTRDTDVFVVPNGLQFVAELQDDLTTTRAREGDRFRLIVRQPFEYEGATIDGYVSRIERGGRVAGRAQMILSFERLTLRDGRSAPFNGYIESIRTVNGEDVRVDVESTGTVQESDNQTDRTVQRAAIGAAVGAIIGAISGGGRGAAIGAAIGAGAGAGSVYIQGRDDLELLRGTQLTLRARTPR